MEPGKVRTQLDQQCYPESRCAQARPSEPSHQGLHIPLPVAPSSPRRPPEVRVVLTALSQLLTSSTASAAPFTEPTSPNPTVTKYAQTAEALHTYGSYLTQCLPKFIQQFSVLKDELTLYTAPSGVIPVLTFLRDHAQCQFKSVMDISGADYPEREKRFEVVYHLLSVKQAGRIRVKTYAGEGDHVPSAVTIFRGADWCVDHLILLYSSIHHLSAGMSVKLGIFSEYSLATILICTWPALCLLL